MESNNTYSIPVQWNTMDLSGYFVGDTIVVDSTLKPIDGECVLINFRNKIQLMEYRTPYLQPQSSDSSHEQIDVGLVDILGVVVTLIHKI